MPMRTNESSNLHLTLSKAFGLAVVLGSTIGVGILRMPGEVAAQVKDFRLILLLWLAGGIFSFLGALTLAELSTRFPEAGGPYTYAKHVFGRRTGFAIGWADWLAFCCVLALLVTVIAEYAAVFVPGVNAKIMSAGILVLFVVLNWFGIQASQAVQQITSFVKLLVFLALVAACLLVGREWPNPPVQTAAASLGLPLILAVQMILGTYAGWHAAVYFVEENRNPNRDIPKALLSGVVIITAVYLLVNLAFMRVLPLPKLAASDLPAADAATTMIGPRSGTAITLLCLWSLLSVVNVYLLSSTRILYSLGRDHQWRSFSQVSKNGTPVYALLGNFAVALILILTRSFEKLVELASFILLIVYTTCFLAHIVSRRRENPRQHFKAWGYPWTTWIALLASIAILAAMIVEDTKSSILGMILLAGTYAFYRFAVSRLFGFLESGSQRTAHSRLEPLPARAMHTNIRTTSSLE